MRHLLSKKEIIIDLTSLLDVIFIVLMVVMVALNLNDQSARTESTATETDQDISAEDMNDHYEKYEYLDQYVVFIDVYSDIGKSTDDFLAERNSHSRMLYCIKGIGEGEERVKWVNPEGDESDHVEITDSTEETILGIDGRLDSKICNLIDAAIQSSEQTEYGNVIVILSVNRNEDKILYRDEVRITQLLEDIAGRYQGENVTIAVR